MGGLDATVSANRNGSEGATRRLHQAAFTLVSVLWLLRSHWHPIFPKNDDTWFFPISYAWKNGLALDNPWANPIGSGILNWHGFLQPMLVAWLSPCGTLGCVQFGLLVLQAIYLAVWAGAVEQIAPSPAWRWVGYLTGLMSLTQYSARPELLASLVLNSLLLFMMTAGAQKSSYLRAGIGGTLAATVAVTDPIGGIFALAGTGAALVCWPLATRAPRSLLTELGVLGFAAVGVFLAFLVVVYPYGAMAWIEGMVEHSRIVAGRGSDNAVFLYYVLTRSTPMLIVMFVPAIWLAAVAVRLARKHGMLHAVLASVFLGIMAIVLWHTSIRLAFAYYNFNLLVPTVTLLTLLAFTRMNLRSLTRRTLEVSLILYVSAGLASFALLTFDKIRNASSYAGQKAEINAKINAYLAQGQRIAIDGVLVQAVDDFATLRRLAIPKYEIPQGHDDLPANIDVRFFTQAEARGFPNPLNAALVFNGFDESIVTRLIKPEALNYAIFERRRDD